MADIGTGQHWLVSPDAEVEKQWIKVQINERKSRIQATKLAYDDLLKVQGERLKGNLMMLERELTELEKKFATVSKGVLVNAEVTEG
jgi:hypothetical protein